MPIPEKATTPAAGTEPEAGTNQLSRRSVLRGAASAGAAGLAISALAGPALAATRPSRASAGHDSAATTSGGDNVADGEDVVVHVRNVRTGEMDVYRGSSHVQVQDRDLAVRLARASK